MLALPLDLSVDDDVDLALVVRHDLLTSPVSLCKLPGVLVGRELSRKLVLHDVS
jgi:hypothetical protein